MYTLCFLLVWSSSYMIDTSLHSVTISNVYMQKWCVCVWCVLYACIYVQILGKDAELPVVLCLETGSLSKPKARLVASPWDHSVSSPRSIGVTNKPTSSFVHRCWGFELRSCCSHTKHSYHWVIFPTPISGYPSFFFSHWLSECFVRQLIGFPSVIAAVYPLSALPVFMSPLKFGFSSSRLISLFLDSFWINSPLCKLVLISHVINIFTQISPIILIASFFKFF